MDLSQFSTLRVAASDLNGQMRGKRVPSSYGAKLDKGAPGPLYVEFYGSMPGSGKRYKVAWFHEHRTYEGEKYVSLEMELEGNNGFNRGKSYAVELVQVNDKGRAGGKVVIYYKSLEQFDDICARLTQKS